MAVDFYCVSNLALFFGVGQEIYLFFEIDLENNYNKTLKKLAFSVVNFPHLSNER
jgi:hypothetical protein